MAKYPYIVNKNGTWYPAGAEVPEGAKSVENKKIAETKETDFSQFMNPPEEKAEVSYTKTDINRMSTSELRDLAKSNGVANAADITGAELKKILIEMLNL